MTFLTMNRNSYYERCYLIQFIFYLPNKYKKEKVHKKNPMRKNHKRQT